MTGINAKRAVERCEQLAILGPPPPWYRPVLLRRWSRLYRAIMALDIGEHAEILRGVYPVEVVTEMANRPNPMLRMMSLDARDHQQHGAAMTSDEVARMRGAR